MRHAASSWIAPSTCYSWRAAEPQNQGPQLLINRRECTRDRTRYWGLRYKKAALIAARRLESIDAGSREWRVFTISLRA